MKQTKKAYSKWAKSYDIDLNPQTLLEHDDVLKQVNAKKGEIILDAACGTGRYTIEFYKKGAKVIGFDFTKEMIKVSKEKNPNIEYRVGDLHKKLPFKNDYFDKINCAQALKHIKNLKPVLKEFYRVLKKGGFLVFSVTHPDMYWDDYELIDKEPFPLGKESNIYHHKFWYYFEVFKDAGFKINTIKQLKVSKKIKHTLTPKSYRKFKGIYQIVIFKLGK